MFRCIIEAIVLSDFGCVEDGVINLASTITPRIKIGDSELYIECLVADSWLLKYDGEHSLLSQMLRFNHI